MKPSFISIPRTSSRHGQKGFTLIEILVAIVVLSLIIIIFAELFQGATSVTQRSNQLAETELMARGLFDRIDLNWEKMINSSSCTAVAVKNIQDSASGTLNDGLGFITTARVRSRADIPNNLIRLASMGFRVMSSPDPSLNAQMVPMLNWGDGTVKWSPAGQSPTGLVSPTAGTDDMLAALVSTANDVSGTKQPTLLNYQPIATEIFRVEICFLRSDGKIVTGKDQTNANDSVPLHTSFASMSPFSQNTNMLPIAFSASYSNDPNKLYIKALIIGVGVLDSLSQIQLGAAKILTLANALPDPTSGQTPLQAWNFQTPNNPSSQALQNALLAIGPQALSGTQCYQKYFYVQ